MKSILWSQANDATSKDIYVIDGVVSLDEQTNEQMSASNMLFECHEWGMFHKNNIQALKKRGKLLNNAFVSYKKGEGFYFSSNYLSKDVVGRRIVFQFFCSTDNFTQAIGEFTRVSKLINREYSNEELQALKEAVLNADADSQEPSNDKDKKRWSFLLVVVALVFVFVKCCTK